MFRVLHLLNLLLNVEFIEVPDKWIRIEHENSILQNSTNLVNV